MCDLTIKDIIVLLDVVFEPFFTYPVYTHVARFWKHSIAALFFAAVLPLIASGFCFDEAGEQQGINPRLLEGIARVESGMNPKAINRNINGTVDIGLMQINSLWLKSLNISREDLLADPCLNARTGALILRRCIDRFGYTWEAVGCYNAVSSEKKVDYAWKVFHSVALCSDRVPGKNRKKNILPVKTTRQSSLVFRVRDETDSERGSP